MGAKTAAFHCLLCRQAARRRGKDQGAVQKNLEQLESILPNLVDLNKMKAVDWVSAGGSSEEAPDQVGTHTTSHQVW